MPRSRKVQVGSSLAERCQLSGVVSSPKRVAGLGWSWQVQNTAFQPPASVMRSCQPAKVSRSIGMLGLAFDQRLPLTLSTRKWWNEKAMASSWFSGFEYSMQCSMVVELISPTVIMPSMPPSCTSSRRYSSTCSPSV